ncbi:hypothetical protein GCM10009554_44430 [Kribbella koreensis]|uniref:Tetratricopeptide repeat protein n=1 Tax=Kribbella koreensis TaxID=57909 RepID=A0ABP4B8Q8_9ACTN
MEPEATTTGDPDWADEVEHPAIQQVGDLLLAERYAEASSLAADLKDDPASRPIAELLLAQIAEDEDNLGQALAHIEDAVRLAPNNVRITAKYLDLLFAVGNYRRALDFASRLSQHVRSHPKVRYEMYWVYYGTDWHAHLREEFSLIPDNDPSEPYVSTIERLYVRLKRATVDHLLLRTERAKAENFKVQCEDLWVIDKLSFRNLSQYYRLNAQLDSAALSYARTFENWRIVRAALRSIFLVAAISGLAVHYSSNSSPHPALERILLMPLSSIAVCVLAASIFRLTRYYSPQTFFIGLTGLAAILTGTGMYRLISQSHSKLHLLSLGIIGGGIIVSAATVSQLITSLYFRKWWRRHYRLFARANVIDMLASILSGMANVDKQNNPVIRRRWLSQLESAAKLLESEVPKEACPNDPVTRAWLSDQLKGVAQTLRHLKRSMIAPSGKSWETASNVLRHQITAISTENWFAAKYRAPEPRAKTSRRDQLQAVGKFVAITLIPGLGYIAIAPVLGAAENSIQRGALLSAAWGLLSALFTLDPAIKDKTAAMREMSDTWSQVADRKIEAEKAPPRPT